MVGSTLVDTVQRGTVNDLRRLCVVVVVALAAVVLNSGFLGVVAASDSVPLRPETSSEAGGSRQSFTLFGVEYGLRYCPPGSYVRERVADDSKVEESYEVTLTQGFWILETEATRQLWKDVLLDYRRRTRYGSSAIFDVGYDGCLFFLEKLNRLPLAPDGYEFRLPTEAEWEYASRAGGPVLMASEAPTSSSEWSELEAQWLADFNEIGDYLVGWNRHMTTPVKSTSPNDWGIYETLGGVPEWCGDYFGSLPTVATSDPRGPREGSKLVVRDDAASEDESTPAEVRRKSYAPDEGVGIGFRFVMAPSREERVAEDTETADEEEVDAADLEESESAFHDALEGLLTELRDWHGELGIDLDAVEFADVDAFHAELFSLLKDYLASDEGDAVDYDESESAFRDALASLLTELRELQGADEEEVDAADLEESESAFHDALEGLLTELRDWHGELGADFDAVEFADVDAFHAELFSLLKDYLASDEGDAVDYDESESAFRDALESLLTELRELQGADEEEVDAIEFDAIEFDDDFVEVESDPTPAGAIQGLTLEGEEYYFRYCPAGIFTMGSASREGVVVGSSDERARRVQLTRGFWILESETPQRLWTAVVGSNPSDDLDDKLPVENVSYDACVDFIRRLNALACAPEGYEFRLPTEAEWEYACRAGSTADFAFGDDVDAEEANINVVGVAAAPQNGPNMRGTTPVKSYQPNSWGIYDMHGNVAEWCADWYARYPNQRDAIDPTGPSTGDSRVIRGGSYTARPFFCRSASRDFSAPDETTPFYGFRFVLAPKEDE